MIDGACSPEKIEMLSKIGVKGFILGTSALFGKGRSYQEIIEELSRIIKMKIGIGNDHVAVEYKKEIKKYIEEKYGYEVVNYGTDSTERFNYPVSGEAVANAVVSGEVDKGIVICWNRSRDLTSGK